MNREERERMVDKLLDSALAAQQVEPREGLEQRILANLRAQPERRPWWRWMWVPALAAAVIIAAIGLYVARRPHPVSPPQVTQQHPNQERRDAETQRATNHFVGPQAIATRGSHSRLRNRQIVRSANQQVALPRQEVFPSPTPLTAEERMLLALVRGNRPEAVNVAQMQESERERVQKYFETGEAPVPLPAPQAAQPMR